MAPASREGTAENTPLGSESGDTVLVDAVTDNGEEAEKETNDGDNASEKGEEEEKEKVYIGTLAESKELYAKFDAEKNRSWTDKYPSDLEEAAENEETQKYAVIVRKMKPKDADSAKPLVIDSLIIQSPYLKKVFGQVFKDYPGIVTSVQRLKLSAPFEYFVHRWDRLEAAKDDESLDETTREHVKIMYDIMRDDLGDLIQLREDYFKNKAVSFEHVWTLFPPGCTVLGTVQGKPVALKFSQGSYVKTQCGDAYNLECNMVDWDGHRMGWRDVELLIPIFQGTVPFTELPAYPLDFHSDVEAVKETLIERGRKFNSLAGFCYKAYNGTAMYYTQKDNKARKEHVQSRIVVDGQNWEQANSDNCIYVSSLENGPTIGGNARRRGSFDSDRSNSLSYRSNSDSGVGYRDEEGQGIKLTEEQLLMTGPVVRGYALKNKRWMEFFVDEVTENKFDEGAFDSLVLPQDQKQLILAFAQSQVKYKGAFDDVISGKGRGIIMLLSGGPGIGKTLTAESVAEEMRVPLYIMSAGDLGARADEVEDNLADILSMVANWNAVLLLDECDVFLEERSAHDMERNRIVSIFLRTLEYYEGILFLTTNRVRNMDPAFQSRIHISLSYPDLDTQARANVWKGFLARSTRGAAHTVSEEEIQQLSGLALNGRQIKNVLKTASLLACSKEEPLGVEHLRVVLRVQGHTL